MTIAKSLCGEYAHMFQTRNLVGSQENAYYPQMGAGVSESTQPSQVSWHCPLPHNFFSLKLMLVLAIVLMETAFSMLKYVSCY